MTAAPNTAKPNAIDKTINVVRTLIADHAPFPKSAHLVTVVAVIPISRPPGAASGSLNTSGRLTRAPLARGYFRPEHKRHGRHAIKHKRRSARSIQLASDFRAGRVRVVIADAFSGTGRSGGCDASPWATHGWEAELGKSNGLFRSFAERRHNSVTA